jgi:Cu+-exporting ATPase
LADAGALQSGSEHPLAKAVLERCSALDIALPAVQDNKTLPGRGVIGTVQGRELALGNQALLESYGLNPGPLQAQANTWEAEGCSLSWLVEASPQRRVLGLLAFADSLKPGARQAVANLLGQGIAVHLLTGDTRGSARVVAHALGIPLHQVYAQVLPAEKAEVINTLKSSAKVAMVGDGINDAPALACADIGIAMGGGTDVAMQAAGITLMSGEPQRVAAALQISRRTYAKIRQNLFWAFIYNLIGVPLAAFGILNPVLAGAAMALSSVCVVSNALLLNTWKPRRGNRDLPQRA